MEYMNSWMYGSLRFKIGFREEVDKFIEATEKHATTLTENKDIIICPCKDCKNLMVWTDVSIIREHLIVRGFIEDYTVWIYCNTLGVWLPHLHLHFMDMSIIHPFMSLDCMKHAFETLQHMFIFHVCFFYEM